MKGHKVSPIDRLTAYGDRKLEKAKIEEALDGIPLTKQEKKELACWLGVYNKVKLEPILLDVDNPIELAISVPRAAEILGCSATRLRTMYDKGELELHRNTFMYLIGLEDFMRLYALKKKGEL